VRARAGILVLLAATLAAAPVLASNYDKPDRLVALPDGRRLNMYCSGSGKPTVLLEAGFEAWSFAWNTPQQKLEQRYRVCSYDRAGLGFSDPGPSPRDGASIAADLNALITAAKLKPPFVLVGHSAGGLSMRLLYERRPADVIGMVFVDSSVEGQFAGREDGVKLTAAGWYACEAPAKAGKLPSSDFPKCGPPVFAWMPPGMQVRQAEIGRGPDYWRTMGSEYESIGTLTSAEVMRARQSYGDLPIVVLTAGTNPSWAAMHAQLAARSTRGVQHVFPTNGHLLQLERPDAVAAAVDEVVAAAKQKATMPP